MIELLLMAAAAGLPIDAAWSLSPAWEDGRAEVAVYDARRSVYGESRSFETVMITVKEDFDRSLWVKADPPYAGKKLQPVLRVSLLSRIPTQNYPYSYMTSLFVAREDPRQLIKMSHSSQEWCGTTFKEVVTWDGPPYLLFHSYFDGQGDGRHALDLGPGALLEEQLVVVLRAARLDPGASVPLLLYDSQITNSARSPAARPVRIRASGEEAIALPAGTRRARPFAIVPEGGTDPLMTFWIGTDSERPVLRFESADGRSLDLRTIERRDYWSR